MAAGSEKTDAMHDMTASKEYFCRWTEPRIRFMRDAYEVVRFHEVLAEHAAAYIGASDTVCDCGCGLGYISMELCRYAARVAAADIQELPLRALGKAAEEKKISNLDILREDVFTDFPAAGDARVFDHLVFSFFGQIPEIIDLGSACARKSVILFRKCWSNHRMSYDEIPISRLRFFKDCDMLDSMGIAYQAETFDLDMGQPFRSIDDAVDYFRTYSRDTDASMLTEDFVRQKLVAADSADFPFYCPMQGKIGMIVIRDEDIVKGNMR